MAEYIEREAVLEKISYMTIRPEDIYDYGIIAGVDAVRKLIKSVHAADVAPVSQWISVDERLPEPDTDVLARRSTGMDVECYHKEDGGYWSWDEYSGKWRVTHWMPLPEPPEVEV